MKIDTPYHCNLHLAVRQSVDFTQWCFYLFALGDMKGMPLSLNSSLRGLRFRDVRMLPQQHKHADRKIQTLALSRYASLQLSVCQQGD